MKIAKLGSRCDVMGKVQLYYITITTSTIGVVVVIINDDDDDDDGGISREHELKMLDKEIQATKIDRKERERERVKKAAKVLKNNTDRQKSSSTVYPFAVSPDHHPSPSSSSSQSQQASVF
ncbi:hypothetical protein DFA_02632 [Cavenderia fasciculata]|uniref:Uncharacterized protein n=1 Tax=Cavenderia fasciculata TaxID=261658 RepID=F4PZX9_CACFS|nr:uncharacterized protein DFA_02632 [Cavenderia fasciculata]EGG18893.1 hypothetical protein DFA_02632 [Cavenderia fasciculata]|eukprot:XP_004357355.1 hypothetical protein DFA_02632 [Cavenderia fasciculata]